MSSVVHFIAGLFLTSWRMLMVMDAMVALNGPTYYVGEINMRSPCTAQWRKQLVSGDYPSPAITLT